MTRDYDRISIHGVRRSVLEAQVAAVGIALVEVPIPAAASNAIYEQALASALAACAAAPGTAPSGVRRLVSGRRARLPRTAARRARLGAVVPAVGQRHGALARDFVKRGFRAILTCVDTTQLGAEYAGREFDSALLASCPRASIRAARTANSIPASTQGRSSRSRSHYAPASASCATAAFSTATYCSTNRFGACLTLPALSLALSARLQRRQLIHERSEWITGSSSARAARG